MTAPNVLLRLLGLRAIPMAASERRLPRKSMVCPAPQTGALRVPQLVGLPFCSVTIAAAGSKCAGNLDLFVTISKGCISLVCWTYGP